MNFSLVGIFFIIFQVYSTDPINLNVLKQIILRDLYILKCRNFDVLHQQILKNTEYFKKHAESTLTSQSSYGYNEIEEMKNSAENTILYLNTYFAINLYLIRERNDAMGEDTTSSRGRYEKPELDQNQPILEQFIYNTYDTAGSENFDFSTWTSLVEYQPDFDTSALSEFLGKLNLFHSLLPDLDPVIEGMPTVFGQINSSFRDGLDLLVSFIKALRTLRFDIACCGYKGIEITEPVLRLLVPPRDRMGQPDFGYIEGMAFLTLLLDSIMFNLKKNESLNAW